MKKLLSILVALILITSMSVIPAYAADNPTSEKSNSEDTREKIISVANKLEEKYNISIKYPKKIDGGLAISMNNLETLDKAFSTMTAGLVKQISSYYEKKNGRKIEVEYYFSNSDYSYNGGVLMAAFEPRSSKIYIFLPAQAGRAIISGENPIALVHEMGHAFHLMCMDLAGEQKMESEWRKFNNGINYNSNLVSDSYNKNIFISLYATTMYEEDFAETFGHLFARNQAGTGFRTRLVKDSSTTGLGKKVNYIEKLIGTYIKNPSAAIENMRRIYDTPTSLKFEGTTFKGETLQYIGYPQPKNILKGILSGLGLVAEESKWVRSLGAWRVIDSEGDMYYIFPGGSWAKALQGQEAAAA